MPRRQHYRGGLGVRKRLSEESLRETYRLNGVPTGSAIARCYDKYGRWEGGFDVGVIVRKTASVVQIRWADSPDEITSYSQGDARYEVDRGRWRVLGLMQGNPLDPENPIAVALTKLRGSETIDARQMPPTEENNMTKEMSNAAAERAAAQKALKSGSLQERETYTAKQVAMRCGTDAKTMRKFFRSSHSTTEPVGQGGRYEFDAKDLPKIKKEFNNWLNRSSVKRPKAASEPGREKSDLEPEIQKEVERFNEVIADHPELDDREPTEEELAEIADLDLDDLEEE